MYVLVHYMYNTYNPKTMYICSSTNRFLSKGGRRGGEGKRRMA